MDRVVSVRRRLAAEHTPFREFAADLVAEYLDDPANVIRVNNLPFGASCLLVRFYFRVYRKRQIRIDQRGIDAFVSGNSSTVLSQPVNTRTSKWAIYIVILFIFRSSLIFRTDTTD